MLEPHPQNRCLGYARVSTYRQTLDAQLDQLRRDGCAKIYREKVTGAHNDRRELLKMLKGLAPGDVVTVTRIDRSTFDLFAIVKQIVDAKAQFRSLAEPWADTGTSTGRLMIAVLGGLADVERDLSRTRTAEGRSRAQKCGQHMGRPPRFTDAQKAEARRRRAEGATLAELARSYDVGKSTISRLRDMKDQTVLASTYRLTATVWRMNAEILLKEFEGRGESMPKNLRAIPFYYLCSHALELLLKCALLKRGVQPDQLKKYDYRHNLSGLLSLLDAKNIPISQNAKRLIGALGEQHQKHNLRYTSLLDDGEPTFMPQPKDIFQVYDELLMAGRISTFGL